MPDDTRTIWAHHESDTRWHALREWVDGRSAVTFCNGRWPTSETVALDVDPAPEQRCGRCDVLVYAKDLGVPREGDAR